MISQWAEPINKMLLAIERRDRTLWAMPIVTDLEMRSIGSALVLGITVFTGQLSTLDRKRAALAEKWLADLVKMKDQTVNPTVLGKISRDIWFYGNSRDETQTAIARLYAALCSLKAKNYLGYKREMAMALAVGTSDPDGNPVPDRLSHLIELYLKAIK